MGEYHDGASLIRHDARIRELETEVAQCKADYYRRTDSFAEEVRRAEKAEARVAELERENAQWALDEDARRHEAREREETE